MRKRTWRSGAAKIKAKTAEKKASGLKEEESSNQANSEKGNDAKRHTRTHRQEWRQKRWNAVEIQDIHQYHIHTHTPRSDAATRYFRSDASSICDCNWSVCQHRQNSMKSYARSLPMRFDCVRPNCNPVTDSLPRSLFECFFFAYCLFVFNYRKLCNRSELSMVDNVCACVCVCVAKYTMKHVESDWHRVKLAVENWLLKMLGFMCSR